MTPADVSACLVTRGNVDLTPILATITEAGITDVTIWNNALEEDEGVFGRYRAIEQAHNQVVYVQDDDCVVPADTIRTLIVGYVRGRIVANMPEEHRAKYTDSCLIGFGAVFDRGLPAAAFGRFVQARRPWNVRDRPDVIFTALTQFTIVDLPVTILDYAYGDDRAYKQAGHARERHAALREARIARARLAA